MNAESQPESESLVVDICIDPEMQEWGVPEYATLDSSGVDLRASNRETIVLKPGVVSLIPTGIKIAIPPGYEAQVRPRSGLALKHGVTLVNSPGTIDADYRGEIGVIATTLKAEGFEVSRGMRIAQLIFAPISRVQFAPQETLPDTDRGAGGFGHTGTGAR